MDSSNLTLPPPWKVWFRFLWACSVLTGSAFDGLLHSPPTRQNRHTAKGVVRFVGFLRLQTAPHAPACSTRSAKPPQKSLRNHHSTHTIGSLAVGGREKRIFSSETAPVSPCLCPLFLSLLAFSVSLLDVFLARCFFRLSHLVLKHPFLPFFGPHTSHFRQNTRLYSFNPNYRTTFHF